MTASYDPDDEKSFLREIGEQLRHARLEAGLTAAEVAERLGVTLKLVTDMETGKHDWTMSELRLHEIAVEARSIWEVKDKRTGEVISHIDRG